MPKIVSDGQGSNNSCSKITLDYNLIKRSYETTDWTKVFLVKNVSDCYNKFIELLSDIVSVGKKVTVLIEI